MPVDISPVTATTQALQALPFSSLIGGPLQACIQAQSQAAMTTIEFIDAVGLYEDPVTHEKKTVTVEFQYQKAGETVKLVVPLLTIVPIPYISINQINIDFTANLSASSSSVTEKTKENNIGAELDAGFQAGWGPYSAKADLKANYSSKKSSRASQESKYSVEYTMNVNVSAGQASMPAGLATVLNILQEGIEQTAPQGLITLTPEMAQVQPNSDIPTTLQATVIDNSGARVGQASVTFEVDRTSLPDTVTINAVVTAGSLVSVDPSLEDMQTITVNTDRGGKASILLTVGNPTAKTTTESCMVTVSTEITNPLSSDTTSLEDSGYLLVLPNDAH